MEIKDNSLYFAKVRPEAIIPTKTDENAGYDIYACTDQDIVLEPHETKLIPTGIAAAVSKDYYLQIEERGSTGSKGIKRSAGVVDSGYRGEIFVAITNASDRPLVICQNEMDTVNIPEARVYPLTKAIAQLIVHRVPKMNVKEIQYDDLIKIESDRGAGALGSSNK